MATSNPNQQSTETLEDEKIDTKRRLEVMENQLNLLLSVTKVKKEDTNKCTENSLTQQQHEDELNSLRAELEEKYKQKMKKEYQMFVEMFQSITFNKEEALISFSHYANSFRVKFLIDLGADTEYKRNDGMNRTALHIAAEVGHTGVVQALVDGSAYLNAAEKSKNTPLHLAAAKGFVGVCKLLVMHKARVNLENNNGETPLHLSAEIGNVEICGILVAANCNVNIRNIIQTNNQTRVRDGTPLHLAASGGHLSVVKLLVESSANTSLKNYDGKTALDLAVSQGKKEVADYLRENSTNKQTTGNSNLKK